MYIFPLLLTLLYSISCLSSDHTIFAHGIIDGPSQIARFEPAIVTPQKSTITFPDAQPCENWGLDRCIQYCTSYLGKKVNRGAMCMGQGQDLTSIDFHMQQYPQPIILYGCSRGSAALLSYLGKYNPTNVAAVVLDGCPAKIHETPMFKVARMGIHPDYTGSIFSTLFPAYDQTTAYTPIEAIEHIKNRQLPILLMHSMQDKVVPVTQALALYQKFKQAGFTNVHIVLIPSGRHSYLLQDDKVKTLYLQGVHSFYKKYGLPYDQQYAQESIPETPLTDTWIQEQFDKYHAEILATYQQSRNTNLLYISLLCLMLGGAYLSSRFIKGVR